ncbi:MAG: hypothetical protein R2684_11445 [Pyrinomonadaceae bacterium]
MSTFLLTAAMVFFAAQSFAQQGTKKNTRPSDGGQTQIEPSKPALPQVYFYKFEKKEFLVSNVSISHDEEGKGEIHFRHRGSEEVLTRPIKLSQATLELLKSKWTELDFLASDISYQSEREYPHLGTMSLSMKRDGKERTATFNWTDNESVKVLTDEYKKIGYEETWKFDIEIARQNQPLESPKIMRTLDSYIRRNQISDPDHLVPFLKELGDDERLPLIARNHALRLLTKIEKDREKKQ